MRSITSMPKGGRPLYLRGMWRDQCQQLVPRNHAVQVHLIQELRLAGLAARQDQAKVGLFHAVIVSIAHSPCQWAVAFLNTIPRSFT